MPTTKERNQEIYAAAYAIVKEFGVERLDQIPGGAARKAQYAVFRHQLIGQVKCHPETARLHLAKAARRLRGESANVAWGGAREGAGRPKAVSIPQVG